MRFTLRAQLVCTAALGGCTPLGLWLYEDPGFQVSRVRFEAVRGADSAVVVGIYFSNPNDYDISTARLELSLALDDRPFGRYAGDSVIPVPKIGNLEMSLAIAPASGRANRRPGVLERSSRRFLVEGYAVFRTPLGERRVRVAHAGALAADGTVEQAGGGENPRPGVGPAMERRVPAVWSAPLEVD